MQKNPNIFFLVRCIFILSILSVGDVVIAQKITIQIEKREVSLNEPFTISVESSEKDINSLTAFPEIESFKKVNISSATSSSTINKKITKTYIRTQIYHPTREGKFEIKPFTMRVNGVEVKHPGETLVVGPLDESKGELFDYIFNEEQKFTELKDDAFIDITIDKNEVFVGEGFHVILALYVALDNEAPMKFPPDMGEQVEEIAQKLRPANCWEENFEIDRVRDPIRMLINHKNYDQYIFYQASFFPLNHEPVEFPVVKLNMIIKNKMAEDEENPNEFNEESETVFKTFYTRPRKVTVKELPKHPLKDQISVGSYYLQENYPYQVLHTGDDFVYEFRIVGEGNIASIRSPFSEYLPSLDVYPPNTQQLIRRDQNKVLGAKIFSFQMIPKDSGTYSLRNYFHWVYFNPISQRYDTLRPNAVIRVSGESIRNAEISSNALIPFYRNINQVSKKSVDLSDRNWVKMIAEICIFFMLVVTAVISYRR